MALEYKSVQEVVRKAETNYIMGVLMLGEHVRWSMRETVEKIFAYVNSRHVSGEVDSLGREKPFFNIVTGAVNIWYRATSLDRKDVTVIADASEDTVLAFLATVILQDWMKRERFGVFLKTWGRTLAQYGSAVVKFVERDGRLIPSIVPWNRLICDPITFDSIPRIEKFYKTPAQLRQMATKGHPNYAGYDLDGVEDLLTAVTARRTLSRLTKDNRADFIELYEVHGELPIALLEKDPLAVTDEKLYETFCSQMHVVSFQKGKGDTYSDFTLFKGKEKKDPYMITHLVEEDGRTMAIGAVEYLFNAQWMTNHTVKQWKDQLDLASKLIFQTADTHLVGKNVLTNIETGEILVHDTDKPLELVPNTGHDITNLQAFKQAWDQQSQDVTSTPDAMRGMTLPSQTAYRQAAALMQQANSFFEVMTENKGLALEDMMREWILPNIKTKLNHKKTITAILEDHQIQKLDSMYVPREAIRRYNQKVVQSLLKGEVPPQFNPQAEQQQVRSDLAPLGNMRSITPDDVTWSSALKDMEWKLDIGVTNEQHDKQMIMQTLSSVLQTIATNPTILQDPNAKLIFAKILDQTGVVSPIELSTTAAAPPPVGQTQSSPQGQLNGLPMNQLQPPMPTQSPLAGLQVK